LTQAAISETEIGESIDPSWGQLQRGFIGPARTSQIAGLLEPYSLSELIVGFARWRLGRTVC
jgi:hypothetical protein